MNGRRCGRATIVTSFSFYICKCAHEQYKLSSSLEVRWTHIRRTSTQTDIYRHVSNTNAPATVQCVAHFSCQLPKPPTIHACSPAGISSSQITQSASEIGMLLAGLSVLLPPHVPQQDSWSTTRMPISPASSMVTSTWVTTSNKGKGQSEPQLVSMKLQQCCISGLYLELVVREVA